MDFIGLSLRLHGRVISTAAGQSVVETSHGPVKVPKAMPDGSTVVLGVRPELVAPKAGENTLSVTLADAMVLGAKTQLHGAAQAEDRLLCEVPGIRDGLQRGQEIEFGWDVADTLVYETAA